ncbi:MAG: GDSL-type esterase/lipase family protein [Chitinivibrionales bacterium]|nr:GDSL-type esterase/lipase family protein [Chitinivibrionales bacterium]
MKRTVRMVAVLVAAAIFLMNSHASAVTKWACIGNSLTDGWTAGNVMVEAYPEKLARLLGSNYTVQNDGKAGILVENYIENSTHWADVQSFQPDIITVKLGTNNSKPEQWTGGGNSSVNFISYLTSFVESLKGICPNAKIFLCLPFPCFKSFNNPYGIDSVVIQTGIIPKIKTVATAKNLPIIDLNTPILGHPELSLDGVHATQAGQDTLAHLLYRAYMATGVTNMVQSHSTIAGFGAHSYLFTVVGDRFSVPSNLAAQVKSIELYNVKGMSLGSAAVQANGLVLVDKAKISRGVVVAKFR